MTKLCFCLLTVFIGFIVSQSAFSQVTCGASPWMSYQGVKIKKLPSSNAYFFVTSHMAIDADGAPNAYHPRDTGIDALANAGFPSGGWKGVLVEDPNFPGKPYVQTGGAFKGYFIAKTTLEDKKLPVTDTNRYVDSTSIPYMVFPGAFEKMFGTGTFGDLGIVRNLKNGKESAFIVADRGPKNAPLGEVSIQLAENLGGISVNPRNGSGMPKGPFLYVLFPKTKSIAPWPISAATLNLQSNNLLSSIGGWANILSCIP
jgi:hypothetical protein